MAPTNQIASIDEPGIKAGEDIAHNLRKEVAGLLGKPSTSFPGAQPVSFGRKHIEELTRQDYYVCEKSDGIRYLLYATTDEGGGEAHFLIDRKNDYWFINNKGLHFPLEQDEAAFHESTLLDGELVWDSLPNGGREPRFLVFDCLVLDGDRLTDRTLDKRIAYLSARLYKPYKKLLKAYPEELEYQPFLVEMKPFQFAYGIEMMFKDVLPKLKHGNDGLIFTCRNTPYKWGTDIHILKWKPPEENTIDFRLRLSFQTIQPDEWERRQGVVDPFVDYDGMPKAELYVYHGNKDAQPYRFFDEVYITPEEWETLKGLGDPLNDRIVECHRDDQERWRILRFRDDKSEANHVSTVSSVMESIKDSVSREDLQQAASRIKAEWKSRQARGQK